MHCEGIIDSLTKLIAIWRATGNDTRHNMSVPGCISSEVALHLLHALRPVSGYGIQYIALFS